MNDLARLFRALADPTRLRILHLLLQRELCVCELQQGLRLPQPLLSRHLAYLRHAGLVANRRKGNRVFYSLTLADRQLARCLRANLEEQATCREDAARIAAVPPARGVRTPPRRRREVSR